MDLMPRAAQPYFHVPTRSGRRPRPLDFVDHRKLVDIEKYVTEIHNLEQLGDVQSILNQQIKFYIDNIISQVLAILVAKSPTKYRELACTEAGALHVSPVGGALDTYATETGTAGDAFAEKVLAQQVDVLDIFIFDNPAIVQISKDDAADFGPDIRLWADSFYSIPAKSKRIKIKNQTAGSNAVYYFVGWFSA